MFEYLVIGGLLLGAYKLFGPKATPATAPGVPPQGLPTTPSAPAGGTANAPGAPAGTGLIPAIPTGPLPPLPVPIPAIDPAALAAAQAAAAALAQAQAGGGSSNAPGAPGGTGLLPVSTPQRPLIVGDFAQIFGAEIPAALLPPAAGPLVAALAATGDALRVQITALTDPTGNPGFLSAVNADVRIPLAFPLTLPVTVFHGPVS